MKPCIWRVQYRCSGRRGIVVASTVIVVDGCFGKSVIHAILKTEFHQEPLKILCYTQHQTVTNKISYLHTFLNALKEGDIFSLFQFIKI